MPLNIDYRPRNFDEFIGNVATINSLKAIFGRESDFPHAILFQGPKGCGKTTLARIIKTVLGCDDGDFTEINSSSDRGIGTARRISEEAQYKSLYGEVKIFLLDEVHQTTKDFQNAMLKALEDCPPHTFYILCTTDPQKLIAALRDRCHTFDVNNLNRSDCMKLLDWVLVSEGVDNISDQAKSKIYEASEGCPRTAVKILDQVIDLHTDEEILDAIKNFNIEETQIKELWDGLLRGDSWSRISPVLSRMDLAEYERLRRAILTTMSKALLKKDDPRINEMLSCFEKNLYDSGQAGFISCCYVACKVGQK